MVFGGLGKFSRIGYRECWHISSIDVKLCRSGLSEYRVSVLYFLSVSKKCIEFGFRIMINRNVPEFHSSSESGHKVNLVADLPDRLWKSNMHDVCFHLQIGRDGVMRQS